MEPTKVTVVLVSKKGSTHLLEVSYVPSQKTDAGFGVHSDWVYGIMYLVSVRVYSQSENSYREYKQEHLSSRFRDRIIRLLEDRRELSPRIFIYEK